MPCKKLRLTNNTFYFFAVSRKGLQDMLLHTPSKRLSGPLTGSVIGLFVLCQACHSDKDPLWRHSCGDSLWSNCLAEKLTEKWRPWEACVCIFSVCVRETTEGDALAKLCSTACVCPCMSFDLLMFALVSVLSTLPVYAHKGSRPNWLFQSRRDDSHFGTL